MIRKTIVYMLKKKHSFAANNGICGFTLIELMLYITIASFLTIAMSNVSIGVFRLYEKMDSIEDAAYTTSHIIETMRIVRDGAYAISHPSPVDVASSSITFAMYDNEVDPTVIFVQEDMLYIRQGNNEPIPLHGEATTVEAEFSASTITNGVDAVDFSLHVSSVTNSPLSIFEADESIASTLSLYFTP